VPLCVGCVEILKAFNIFNFLCVLLPVLIGDKAFEFVHFGCVGRGYNI